MNLKKLVSIAFLAISGLVFTQASQASVMYEWVCDATDCNSGDPAFSFNSVVEISDAAYAAGSFTGVSGNVLSWNTTTSWGGGYSLNLSDILSGTSPIDDYHDLSMALNGDKSVISDLMDISSGTNITFDNASSGRVDFFEGTNENYSAGSLIDYSTGSAYSNFVIQGHFVRTSSVPEPAALFLLGIGMLGLFVARQRATS